MRSKFMIGLVILAVLGGLYAAALARKPKPAPPTTKQIWAQSGTPVEISTISRGDMEQTVQVTGDINALSNVTLSSKIQARLTGVFVREGDRVTQGQTVAMLDQDDAYSNLRTAQAGLESAVARLSQAVTNAKVTRIESKATIDQAESNLRATISRLDVAKVPNRSQEKMVAENRVESAKAQLDNAQANYKRYESLMNEGAIAPSDFDVVKTQYLVAQSDYKSAKEQLGMMNEGGRIEDISAAHSQVEVAQEQVRTARAHASENMLREEDVKAAKAALRQAEATVALARKQLEYTYIKSSISGEVSARSAEPGQVVAIGQAVISVVNLNTTYFKGDISEKEFGRVAKGQHVRVLVDAFPNVRFDGTVAELYPSASTMSRNFSARIVIQKNNYRIKPGMFARGEVVTGASRNVLLIPKDAIDERKGTQSVFTVKPDGTVKRHIVEVLHENRAYVEIQMPTDLNAGDTVVTQGRQNLQEGTRVHVAN